MIKKTLALALPALALLGSCSLDNGKDEISFTEAVNNLIIPDDDAAEVTVQAKGTYNFVYDFAGYKMSITTNDLMINGKTGGMQTNAMDFQLLSNGAARLMVFDDGTGAATGALGGMKVSDVEGITSEEYFYYSTPVAIFPAFAMNVMPLIQYEIGDYTVKTFASNSYFVGTTDTSFTMGGQASTFKCEEAIYRVVFNDDLKKANLVIYNIQFAAQMPKLAAVVLEDLNVEYSRDGYKITGSEVEPKMLDGSTLVPYPDRIFNSFELKTVSDDLAVVECKYTCAQIFHGEFKGRCVPQVNKD